MVQLVSVLLLGVEIYLVKEIYDAFVEIKNLHASGPIIKINPPKGSKPIKLGPTHNHPDCSLPTQSPAITFTYPDFVPEQDAQYEVYEGENHWTFYPQFGISFPFYPASWFVRQKIPDAPVCTWEFDNPKCNGYVSYVNFPVKGHSKLS